MALSQFLRDNLLCPLTRKPLLYDEAGSRLISTDPETRRAYRIDDDVPIMFVDDSEELDVATWNSLVAKLGGAAASAPKAVAAAPAEEHDEAEGSEAESAEDAGSDEAPKKKRGRPKKQKEE